MPKKGKSKGYRFRKDRQRDQKRESRQLNSVEWNAVGSDDVTDSGEPLATSANNPANVPSHQVISISRGQSSTSDRCTFVNTPPPVPSRREAASHLEPRRRETSGHSETCRHEAAGHPEPSRHEASGDPAPRKCESSSHPEPSRREASGHPEPRGREASGHPEPSRHEGASHPERRCESSGHPEPRRCEASGHSFTLPVHPDLYANEEQTTRLHSEEPLNINTVPDQDTTRYYVPIVLKGDSIFESDTFIAEPIKSLNLRESDKHIPDLGNFGEQKTLKTGTINEKRDKIEGIHTFKQSKKKQSERRDKTDELKSCNKKMRCDTETEIMDTHDSTQLIYKEIERQQKLLERQQKYKEGMANMLENVSEQHSHKQKKHDRKRKAERWKQTTDGESENKIRKNTIAVQKHRSKMTDQQKQKYKITDKKRKAEAKLKMTDQQKQKYKITDKKRRAQSKLKMTAQQKQKYKITDKKRKAEAKLKMTDQEKQKYKITDKKRRAQSKLKMTDQQKQKYKITDKKRKAEAKLKMTDQQKQKYKITDKKRKAEAKLKMTDQQKQKYKITDKKRKAEAKLKMTDQQKQKYKITDKKRKAEAKLKMTDQQKQKYKITDKKRKAEAKLKITDQQKQKYKITDKKRKAEAKLKMTDQQKQKYKITVKKRKAQAKLKITDQQKQKYKITDKKRKAEAKLKMTDQQKQKYKITDKKRKAEAKLKMTDQQKQNTKQVDRKRKHEAMQQMTDGEKQSKIAKNATAKGKHKMKMTDQQKQQVQEMDKIRKQRFRAMQSQIEQKAIQTFRSQVKEGPIFVCTCCHRLMYREFVNIFTPSNFSKCDNLLLERCISGYQHTDNRQYICKTCDWNLKRNKIPPQAVENGLQLDPIADELQNLSTLECMLISRRVPFMKILALPRGKQRAIHGCVVNVPVNPEESCSVLPRLPSSSAIITVKLKRKLQYRGHVIKQCVSPWRVFQALYHLKYISQNPHYQDVIINEHWNEDAAHDNEELWDSLTSENQSGEGSSFSVLPDEDESHKGSSATSSNTDENTENCEQNEDDEEDENAKMRGLPFDSCLQPKDISSDKDLALSIAPGEGKVPISLYADKNNEELAFPMQFPKGRFGWNHKREQNLSMKKYFSARLLNVDGRFSKSTEYLFYAQYRCEAKEVSDSVSIALRKCKGKQQNITAGQIKDATEIRKLIRNDLSLNFLQKIRGSPAYYNKLLLDLLGMVRQLGNCTWFLTLSAADLKWTETIQIIAAQNSEFLSDEQVNQLTWEQKCMWLRTNPVTAARHFDHRLQMFMKTLVLGELHPIGHVQDYKYRIEFQQRGSPHAHMLIWVKGAPDVKDSSEEEVSQFVDKYISCSIPTVDDELTDLVTTLQKHSHSSACKKPGKSCRFAFPRPPLDKTTVFHPAEETITEQTKGLYSDILTSVYDKVSALEADSDPSLDELLQDIQVPLEMYMKALQWIKTKQGRPGVLIRRKPKEGSINFYNPTLLRAWQANMDIQIVDHVESCIMYVSSYISKPEKTLGDVLKSVSKTCEPQGPKRMMQVVSKKFLTHREVSAQEAVYRLLSLPLVRGSRQVLFVPTDLPENRTKLLKPLKVIQTLEDDDEDLYLSGILDKYADRPCSVENLCLADFAALYSYGGKSNNKEPELDEFSESDSQENEAIQHLESLPKIIQLKTMKTKFKKRTKPAIVRTHQYSLRKQEEEFYHSKLLLYFPWRNEEADLKADDGTYKSSFIDNLEVFTDKMTEYEPNAEEYNRAVDDLMENGPPEDAWATLAAQTEQQRGEDRDQGPTDDPDFSAIAPPVDAQPADLGLQHAEFEHETSRVSTEEWQNMILSLNEEQRPVHQYILEWCSNMSLTYKTSKRPDAFHLFLTGGAGVGKSHVIKTIVQTVKRRLNIGQSEDDITVMVCAYMGSAAFNVQGYTLHSSFHLPLNESKHDDYIRLSNEQLSAMRSKLGNLCLLIIDEISMVANDQLLTIHRRLADIMNSDEPFGGVSILAVGDLYQLGPVGRLPVFMPPSDALAALYGSLWKKHFQIIELTQIMRQKNDMLFANTLNRFRTQEQTKEDIALIQTRNVENLQEQPPLKTLHIFPLNKHVDSHNENMLEYLGEQVITIQSIDSKTDHQTGRVEDVKLGENASGLRKEIKLAVGAKVMLTKNIDVADGLANTALGSVKAFIPSPPASDHPDFTTYRPKYVIVQFEEERVGQKTKQRLKHLVPDGVSVPIAAIEVFAKYKTVSAKRTQFPLTLAWAITIHKAQGKTVDQLVVSMNGTYRCGQLYTALSRVKTLDGLYIVGEFTANKVKADNRSKDEMERLNRYYKFKVSIPATVMASPAVYFKLSLMNINSLKPHFKCLAVDEMVTCSDVISLTETWLRPTDNSSQFDLPQKPIVRQDSLETRHGPSGGVAVYLSTEFHLVRRYEINIPHLQYLCLLLQDRADPAARLLVITLYNPPNTTSRMFFKQLDTLLSKTPCDSVSTVLCGDFNMNSLKEDNTTKTLSRITKYYRFRQYGSCVTHRCGAGLDHIYINRDLHGSILFSSTPVSYSDHFHVQMSVPSRNLFL